MYYQIGFNDTFTDLTQSEFNNLDIDKKRIKNALNNYNIQVIKSILSKYTNQYQLTLVKSMCNELNSELFGILYACINDKS